MHGDKMDDALLACFKDRPTMSPDLRASVLREAIRREELATGRLLLIIEIASLVLGALLVAAVAVMLGGTVIWLLLLAHAVIGGCITLWMVFLSGQQSKSIGRNLYYE